MEKLWSKSIKSKGKMIFLDLISNDYGTSLCITESKKGEDGQYKKFRIYVPADNIKDLVAACNEIPSHPVASTKKNEQESF